jgi:aminoglycoside 6'-N-acetyltransferase
MNKMLYDFPLSFESKRLSLRCYQVEDGKWYYSMGLKNREHLYRYESDNPAVHLASEEEAEKLMQEFHADWEAHNCFFIGVFEKESGEFVGQVYVGPVNWDLPEFEIGYFADVDHEGQGFITEAVKATLGILFDKLNAHRVHLKCDETNRRSIRVAERCRMHREGILRENRRNPDGTYSSSYIYGLLKSEFEAG